MSHHDETNDPKDHPVSEGNLPSYQAIAYRERLPDLCFVEDAFCGLGAWYRDGAVRDEKKAQKYLPRETKERSDSYKSRFSRSVFFEKFKPAIKGFAGILPVDSLSDDVFPGIEECQTDVDLRGTNLEAFFSAADEAALRDGAVGIMVEFPRQPRDEKGQKLIRSAADEKKFKLRPYLCIIERQQIINWKVSYANGKMRIEMLCLKEHTMEPDGLYGEKEATYYRILRPGSWELWEVKRVQGKWEAELIDEGGTTLKEIPLVMYSVTDVCPFDAEPPFKNLAEMNFSHYQLYSDYRELIRKLCLPVPVRKGLVMPGAPVDNLPPLILGPNSCVDIPTDGDFYFAEPSGAAIAAIRLELDKLVEEMTRVTLGFLSSESGEAKTATEVQLAAGSTQASLAGMALMKESAIEEVFRLWASYYGQEAGGSASINKDILQVRLDPQIIAAYSAMAAQNQISLLTFLKMLKEGQVLPRDVEPDTEAEQVSQQMEERQKQAMEVAAAQAELNPRKGEEGQGYDGKKPPT